MVGGILAGLRILEAYDETALADADPEVLASHEGLPHRELRLGFAAAARLLAIVVLILADGAELVIHADVPTCCPDRTRPGLSQPAGRVARAASPAAV